MTYDAFISYAHGADDELAAVLQRALSRFAKPWYRRRALHVFLDDRALSANPGLWSAITTTLDDSAWFVLLASPEAARSDWVNREIEHWLASHPTNQMLAVVTNGDWEWSRATADFDWQRSSAVPATLRGAFTEEPLYVDLRWARTESTLSDGTPRMREAVASLVAPIHGVARDEIEGQDLHEHRRTVRTARVVGAALVLLTIAAAFGAFLAVGNSQRADRARSDSDFRRVVAEARDLRFNNPELAALLAVQARHLRDTPLSRGAIQAVLLGDPRFLGTRLGHADGSGYRSLCVVGDGKGGSTAIAGGADGTVTFIDPTGAVPAVRTHPTDGRRGAGRLGSLGCAANAAGEAVVFSDTGHVWTVDAATRAVTSPPRTIPRSLNDVAISPDGNVLAAGSPDGNVEVWLRDGPTLQTLDSGPGAAAVAFSPDGTTLMSTGADGVVEWDTRTWTVRSRISDPGLTQTGGVVRVPGRHLAFSPDGRSLVETRRALVRVFDVATRAIRWSRAFDLGYPSPAVFAPHSASVFVDTPAAGIEELDAATGDRIGATFHSTEAFGELVSVTPDGATLLAASFGRPALSVWSLDGRSLIGRPIASSSHAHPSYSPSGGALLVQESAFDLASPGAVFDTATGRLIASVPNAAVPRLLDDHTVTAMFTDPWAVDRLDLATGRRIGPPQAIDKLDRLLTATSDAAGRVLIAYADGTVRQFDGSGTSGPASQQPWLTLDKPANLIVLSPRGDAASLTTATGVTVYRLEDGRPVFPEVRGAGGGWFTSDGSLVVTLTTDNRFVFLDARTGKPAGRAVPTDGSRAAAAFSAVDFVLAGASGGQLYDLASRLPIGDPFPSIGLPALRPDGMQLATETDHGIVLWDLDANHWEAAACKLSGRNLTRDEWRRYFPSAGGYRVTCPDFAPGP